MVALDNPTQANNGQNRLIQGARESVRLNLVGDTFNFLRDNSYNIGYNIINPILVVRRHLIFQPNKTYDQSDILSLHFHNYTSLRSEFSNKSPL